MSDYVEAPLPEQPDEDKELWRGLYADRLLFALSICPYQVLPDLNSRHAGILGPWLTALKVPPSSPRQAEFRYCVAHRLLLISGIRMETRTAEQIASALLAAQATGHFPPPPSCDKQAELSADETINAVWDGAYTIGNASYLLFLVSVDPNAVYGALQHKPSRLPLWLSVIKGSIFAGEAKYRDEMEQYRRNLINRLQHARVQPQYQGMHKQLLKCLETTRYEVEY